MMIMDKIIAVTPPDKHPGCQFARAARPSSALMVGETVVAAYHCPECRGVWQTAWALDVLAVEPKRVEAEWTGPSVIRDTALYDALTEHGVRRCAECGNIRGAHKVVCSHVNEPAPDLNPAEEAYWASVRPRSHHHD